MMKKRYTEEQIIGILREGQAGVKVADLCRKHGISDAKRLRGLEAENGKLKRLLAEAILDRDAMQTVIRGNKWA